MPRGVMAREEDTKYYQESTGRTFELVDKLLIYYDDGWRLHSAKGAHLDLPDLTMVADTLEESIEYFRKSSNKVCIPEKPTKQHCAALLALLADEEGEEIVVRYLKSIRGLGTKQAGYFQFSNTELHKALGVTRVSGGGDDHGAAAAKEAFPWKPENLGIGTYEANDHHIGAFLLQILMHFEFEKEWHPLRNHIMDAAQALHDGKELPWYVPTGVGEVAAYRDYLGELFGPIALRYGHHVIGDAVSVDQSAAVAYPQSANNALYDSKIGNTHISSKGNKGASASTRSLVPFLDCVEVANAKERHAVDIIKKIHAYSQYEGPVRLAYDYGLINEVERDHVLDTLCLNVRGYHYLDGGAGADEYCEPPPQDIVNLRELCYTYGVKETNGIIMYGTPMEIMDRRSDLGVYSPGYHLLSVIAKGFQREVERNYKDGIASVISKVLAKRRMIQIHASVETREDGAIRFLPFRIVDPSQNVKEIIIDAGKNYTSRQIKGKLNFKIKN